MTKIGILGVNVVKPNADPVLSQNVLIFSPQHFCSAKSIGAMSVRDWSPQGLSHQYRTAQQLDKKTGKDRQAYKLPAVKGIYHAI